MTTPSVSPYSRSSPTSVAAHSIHGASDGCVSRTHRIGFWIIEILRKCIITVPSILIKHRCGKVTREILKAKNELFVSSNRLGQYWVVTFSLSRNDSAIR